MASKYMLSALRSHLATNTDDNNEDKITDAVTDKLLNTLHQLIDPTLVLSLLLENQVTLDYVSALNLAVSLDSVECVKQILDPLEARERLALMRVRTVGQETCLHQAVNNNSVRCVQVLIESLMGDDQWALLSIRDEHGNTALHMAAHSRYTDIIRLILKLVHSSGRKVLLTMRNSYDQHTVMHLAVENNDWNTVSCCLAALTPSERSLLIAVQDVTGSTVLHKAITRNKTDIVKNLLDSINQEYKLDLLKMTSSGDTALHAAVSTDSIIIIQSILNCLDSAERLTLLKMADTNNKMVLQKALDKNSVPIIRTILDFKIGNSDEQLVDLLKETFILHKFLKEDQTDAVGMLMSRLNHEQRQHILSQTDDSGKKVYDIASSPILKRFLLWTKSQNRSYYLPTPPAAVIFSTQNKEEADQDRASLERALQRFNVNLTFQVGTTTSAILDQIRKVQAAQDDLSALIVIIKSGGVQGDPEHEQSVGLQDILQQMNSASLQGKPKVLLMQAGESRSLLDGSFEKEILTTSIEDESECSGTDVGAINNNTTELQCDITKCAIVQPDMLVLTAHHTGGAHSHTNTLISTFADNLNKSGKKDDLSKVFSKTYKFMQETRPDIKVLFKSTLTQELSLRNVFNPSTATHKSLLGRLVDNLKRI